MFQDTIPDGLRSSAAEAAPPAMPRRTGPAQAGGHRLGIRFTGSGSEYFRIWIVNLLLTIVTLGLYYPWAKVRRLKYFHGNTLVDGEPLGFHGNPRKMLRGYLLMALMFVLYSVAGQVSPIAGLVALVIVAVVSPALLRASLQFRLANTSWRGLRLRFGGSLREVYVLLWPSLGMLALSAGMGALLALQGAAMPAEAGVWPVLLLFPLYAVLIWTFWRLKKYQHDHYGWASLQTRFEVPVRRFYGLALRSAGVVLLAAVASSLLVFLLTRVIGSSGAGGAAAFSMVPLLIVLGVFVVLKPYITTRLQNLVWNGTSGDGLQFGSTLGYRPMVWMTLRNWLLILVTLGLYWPFAAVAMARLRLQAVSLVLQEDPAMRAGMSRAGVDDATGDAAGDLFGIDIGF